MNEDDYDEDGNNIVPCPICLDVYCPSKEGGKCPEEEEFANKETKARFSRGKRVVAKTGLLPS